MNRWIWFAAVALVPAVAVAGSVTLTQRSISNAEIVQRIIEESIASYPGNCPCPYNVDRAGRRCGGRSAYSRRGGYAPLCFEGDVNPEQIRRYQVRVQ